MDLMLCLITLFALSRVKRKTVSLIKGPSSWRVTKGKESDEVQGIQFSFISSGSSKNGTGVNTGQFPAFIFGTM